MFGIETASVAAVAIAASIAFPPFFKIFIPASVAFMWPLTTIPNLVFNFIENLLNRKAFARS